MLAVRSNELSERGDRVNERTWERIERSRERWDVLRHPFYRRWSAGELTADELARYSGQYRHAVEAIATMSAAAADALPERPELRRHAAEELGHLRLWDGFVNASGGDASDMPTSETEECVRAWTADDGVAAILARLYAIESGQPEISSTKREGLLERYGFSDGAGHGLLPDPRDPGRRARGGGSRADRRARRREPTRTSSSRPPSRPSAPTGGCSTESRRRRGWAADAVTSCSAIVLGIALGLAIVAVFVFVFSEDTVDAPSIDEGAPTERPAEP